MSYQHQFTDDNSLIHAPSTLLFLSQLYVFLLQSSLFYSQEKRKFEANESKE